MRRLAWLLAALAFATPAHAAEGGAVASQHWSFGGLFGTYDRGALQRGLQVYREVCATCHSMNLIAYRNLTALGYSLDEVRALAASAEYPSISDTGDPATRPGTIADRLRWPYPNVQAARTTNNGAVPPDLSLMTKARVGGPDYVYGLLTGYADPPAGEQISEGMHYNIAFPGHQIAMPPPLTEGRVQYTDGTAPTVAQLARDVTTFLNWAAEPELEARKRLGVQTILYLLVLTGLLYAAKRKIWARLH